VARPAILDCLAPVLGLLPPKNHFEPEAHFLAPAPAPAHAPEEVDLILSREGLWPGQPSLIVLLLCLGCCLPIIILNLRLIVLHLPLLLLLLLLLRRLTQYRILPLLGIAMACYIVQELICQVVSLIDIMLRRRLRQRVGVTIGRDIFNVRVENVEMLPV
jgi:hypothetical protein